MTDLPTGTVTFLFTDIEGSTGLLQALGDGYAAVLDEHATILRRAIADNGGVEVSTHGDAFFAVFTSPTAAVRAAVAAQRALAAHDWSTPGRVPSAGTTTSASTCTGRPGSPTRPTAAR
jgi:class 3 adenylate cyclase